MMNRSQKEALVASLKDSFSTSSASFLVGVQGLTVEQLETLRGELREKNGKLQIAKVRLIKRALDGVAEVEGLDPYMQNQIALVFANNEAPAVAKVLCDYSKKNQQLQVVAGAMDANILDKDAVNTIASLPSKEVLLAQLAATLQAPIRGYVCALQQMLTKLVVVLDNVEKSKNNN